MEERCVNCGHLLSQHRPGGNCYLARCVCVGMLPNAPDLPERPKAPPKKKKKKAAKKK